MSGSTELNNKEMEALRVIKFETLILLLLVVLSYAFCGGAP